MRCRLTVLSTGHEVVPIRNGEVEGYCYSGPEDGKRFSMHSNRRGPGESVQITTTSHITGRTVWVTDEEIEFATRYSTYRWERLEEE